MVTAVNDRDYTLQHAIQRVETSNPSDVTLTGRNVQVDGNSLTKLSTVAAGWNADAYSNQNSTSTAFLSFTMPANNAELVIGLNQDPVTDSDKTGIDYAWHFHDNGTVTISENGTEIDLGGTATSTGGGTTPPPTTANLKVTFYGDSFTYGYDGAAGGGRVSVPVPEYVDSRTNGATIVNNGVNSNGTVKQIDGTNGVHPAWSVQMAGDNSDWIIIALLFHDIFDLTPAAYRSNLRTLYNGAINTGKKVAFQTCHKVSPTIGDPSVLVQAMKDEAASLGIHCIDVYTFSQTAFTGDIMTWVPDGYHPAQAGYNKIGEYVANQLLTFIPGLTSVDGAGSGGGNAGGGTGGGTTPTPSAGYPQSGTIACWGDSITYGLDENFSDVAVSPVTTFANNISGFTVNNEGISDNTTTRSINGTDTVHQAFQTWITNRKPTYIIIQLCFNEHFVDGGITVDQYKANLLSMANTAKSVGTIPIFETLNETTHETQVSAYRQAMWDLGVEQTIKVIDQFAYLYKYRTDNGLAITDMYPNGYHPTQAVYTLKGEFAAKRFKEIIGAS